MNKITLFLLFTVLAVRVSASSSVEAAVSARNYSLARVLVPQRTYAGVLVNAQVVKVQTGPRGLVPGLTLGLANFALGTNIGGKTVSVHEYVVRLDSVNSEPADLITVVQGGSELYRPGMAVFLSTRSSEDGVMFEVRMIPATTPDSYPVEGLEEARLRTKRKQG